MRANQLKQIDRGYKYDDRSACVSTDRFIRDHKITELPLKTTVAKQNGLLQGICMTLTILAFLGAFCGLIGWVDWMWPE